MKRSASAVWKGGLKDGRGAVSTSSGVLSNVPYNFAMRFENETGTNPEELIAAAHAACFSMALSAILSADGHTPDSVQAQAKVHLRNVDGKPTIQRIDLEVHGEVPGLGDDEFRGYAEKAKADCVVSRALAGVPEIELTVT